jgi:quercetin dioxygenase-like cupin family protein
MKNIKKLIQFVLSVAMVGCFTACTTAEKGSEEQQETTEKAAATTPVSPEVVFENDYAKVVKVSLAPGNSLAPHNGEARVIYSLSDYTIDWTEKAENQGTKSWKQGDIHAHEAGEHSAANNGTATAEWLAFIKKETELPDCADNTLENDVNSVAPDFVQQRFDNEGFKVTEVNLPAGGKIPMHAGVNRIIYSLSDYQILYESDKEGTGEKSFEDGEIHWHEACQHALENSGDAEAKFLVVAYKK